MLFRSMTLLREIKRLRPQTPILLITGHGEHDLTLQALRGGAYDFLQKPIERDYLVVTLQRALELRQLGRQVEAQRLALEQHAAQLELKVQERTRELLEASRAQEEFMRIASHELFTPLTTLKLLAQLVSRQLERAGIPLGAHLPRMEQAVARMDQLIKDLLDVSRIGAGKLALRLGPCDLQALCQQVAEEQATLTGRVITCTMTGNPRAVEGDADRLRQVLINLLSNALKYSPATTPVSLSLEQGKEGVTLCVRDQGAGIPAEALPHLFDRFYRVPGIEVQSGSGVGLGLGLYICREMVELHGGRIWAESTEGVGSSFYVTLPVAGAASQKQELSGEEPSAELLRQRAAETAESESATSQSARKRSRT